MAVYEERAYPDIAKQSFAIFEFENIIVILLIGKYDDRRAGE
ncbi:MULTISPECIES: hypothetical protein [Aneurinibacillus]|nr:MULTISPECIES: hypothetical protein [Aneurinibacillus]MED0676284.1 hypothetical protein [Aneurinibacillus thermoaerophilus]MED0678675.1 hypothetical protein [Aneurinibacillus thermoaerophilus]MED0736635.1 hypothetical protein [Aneurinibacillus thermoaerophilus]MED0755813.1 hypothetical protein [Aneurinibacillus thermoaerophilus]MED0759539.1 hypothetical protein [Aneurinibacillus thermoaerophilus]